MTVNILASPISRVWEVEPWAEDQAILENKGAFLH